MPSKLKKKKNTEKNMKLSCRYLLEQMEKREGFHLLWKVRQCFKHSEEESIFPLQNLIK